jgi:hypothetical protein
LDAQIAIDGCNKDEAQEEFSQAIALFARSKMTIPPERAKAILSKFSDS